MYKFVQTHFEAIENHLREFLGKGFVSSRKFEKGRNEGYKKRARKGNRKGGRRGSSRGVAKDQRRECTRPEKNLRKTEHTCGGQTLNFTNSERKTIFLILLSIFS
jgi:hypothetical protein